MADQQIPNAATWPASLFITLLHLTFFLHWMCSSLIYACDADVVIRKKNVLMHSVGKELSLEVHVGLE